MIKSSCLILIIVATFIGCQYSSKSLSKKPSSTFWLYANSLKYKSTKKEVVPILKKLPDYVYSDALKLSSTNHELYRQCLNIILLKLNLYYLSNFNQGYSLVSFQKDRRINKNSNANNKFYILNSFMKISGLKIERDGFPSSLIYYDCQANPIKIKEVKMLLDKIDIEYERIKRMNPNYEDGMKE